MENKGLPIITINELRHTQKQALLSTFTKRYHLTLRLDIGWKNRPPSRPRSGFVIRNGPPAVGSLQVSRPGPLQPRQGLSVIGRWHRGVMALGTVPVEVDVELVERASGVGAPAGRGADAIVEDALRAFIRTEVIDSVRARNHGVDPEEIAALGRSELRSWSTEPQHAES